jgi:hypothetical protein
LEEKDGNAATTYNGKETLSYFHPTSPAIHFSIFPSIGQETFPHLKEFLDYADVEEFDAFLILTAEKFDKRHLIFAKGVKSINKPVFFVRTKVDNNNPEEDEDECKEKTTVNELRMGFVEYLKKFDFTKDDIYMISNKQPVIWDFLKLVKALEAALPSQRGRFTKIPMIMKLFALEKFHNFLQGTKCCMASNAKFV